ncbi:MAG: tRNA threonylcarbamoyladenosine biosynthesis protein TsaE [Pseudomonadota bacterium]|nr:tRNA threonylcarbamoyladenosine biosynthesis protein TsaE [Pseudomonadota bacterium]
MLRLAAADPEQMRALGARLGAAICATGAEPALVIGLSGELGAGKTTLVAGLLAGLGHAGPVRSPTYTLIEPYRLAGRDLYHCDLYRLRDPADLDDLGLRDLAVERSVLLVEWPERAGDRLGKPDLLLQIEYAPSGRAIEIDSASEAGRQVLAALCLDPA